jgi:hypothetical protein
MRRTIIFALVVSLAAVALGPVFVCMLPASRIANINTAEIQTQCDEMDMRMDVPMDASHPSVSAQPGVSCCAVSQTPRPESRYTPGKPLVPIARLSAAVGAYTLFISKQKLSATQEHDYSPPELQSLLCIFLV